MPWLGLTWRGWWTTISMPTRPSCLCDTEAMKGQQKPKKVGKKPAQKTLKERRTEKRAAAKHSKSLDV